MGQLDMRYVVAATRAPSGVLGIRTPDESMVMKEVLRLRDSSRLSPSRCVAPESAFCASCLLGYA
jgi:hypothetical protein